MSNISRYISAPAILSALALSACSDDQPVLTHRDLDVTDTFFASAEAQSQNIYYKPYVGFTE